MRQVINPQLQFGEQDISAIALDLRSRDDIPRILAGLQYIYVTPALREEVFAMLAEVLPEGKDGKVSAETGRPGMEQWKILVLGTLRLGLNADYDRIQELANQHATIRQMLGHGAWDEDIHYSLQTLKENLRLFTPELLDRINQVVVRAGHQLVKKSPEEGLNARADSFVVETDVHYPTDINLLLDAVRKSIETCAQLCKDEGLSEWRQSRYNIGQLKKLYRRLQRLKRSTSKDPDKCTARQGEIEQACRDYLALAEQFLARARDTRAILHIGQELPAALLADLDGFYPRNLAHFRSPARVAASFRSFSIFHIVAMHMKYYLLPYSAE
jgi:IS5 family transposase